MDLCPPSVVHREIATRLAARGRLEDPAPMDHVTADAAAYQLLHGQHGYALVSQLHELGLTARQIALRVRKGVFERIAHGVIGLPNPRATVAARAMRAVLVTGTGAAASHWTAAHLHRLDAPRTAATHVVVEGRRRQSPRPDIRVHRTRRLPVEHVTEVAGVPTTTLPRTLVDCAPELDAWSALQMLDSCSASDAVWREIHRTAEQLSNGRAGVRAIASVTAPDGAQRFRSTLERRAADTLAAHGLPPGEWNVTVSDGDGPIREVDLLYRDQGLVVELDGLRFHMRRAQARRDRSTDRRLLLLGIRVLRFSPEDVIRRPAAMARDVKDALHAII